MCGSRNRGKSFIHHVFALYLLSYIINQFFVEITRVNLVLGKVACSLSSHFVNAQFGTFDLACAEHNSISLS